MKRILLYLVLISFMYGCNKREYINDNTNCVFKNYLSPDTLPYDIAKLPIQTSFTKKEFNDVVNLNAFQCADSLHHTFLKVSDTLSLFLDQKYAEACMEKELDLYGQNTEDNYSGNTYHVKNYYYCGSVNLQKDINSLIFLNSDSDNDFNSCDLILFNIKNNKLFSLIKLSSFAWELDPKSVFLRTFIVKDFLISIESPFEGISESHKLVLNSKQNNVSISAVPEGVKSQFPFTYYLFKVRNSGYIHVLPSFVKVENVDLIGNKCNYLWSRSIM